LEDEVVGNLFACGRLGQVVCVALLGCLIVGCSGGDVSTLSGTVTFEGQPLAEGNLRLMPADGGAGHGAGAKIVNGSYDIPSSGGLTPGRYSVMISSTRAATTEETARMGAGGEGGDDPDEEEGEGDAPPQVQLIPARYNVATTLSVTVDKGANTENFDLQP
jgi:hypothetical protein